MSTSIVITDHGAIAGGEELNSAAIQGAIDAAAAAGGGTVIVPPGVFRTGTIQLRSHVLLELSPGAKLVGSRAIADYPPHPTTTNPDDNVDLQPHHLIVADGITGAGIRGPGIIDGSGPAFWDPPQACAYFTRKSQRPSPMLEIRGVRDFVLDGVGIVDSPGWTVHIRDAENVRIRGVDIRNNLLGPNTDGMDITDSRDVFISDCNLVCGDDAIVLKSLGGVNERIVVTNCVLQTNCAALKLGAAESFGTIRQVAMSNCVVRNSSRGIGLYNLAGGTFEDVSFSNIVLDCHNDMPLVCPIHIDCSRGPDFTERTPGRIRNVRISDVQVRSDARILLTAAPGAMLENIALRGIHMSYPAVEGGLERARAAVSIQFSPCNPDARGAAAVLVAENVRGLEARDISVDWPADCTEPMHVFWGRGIDGGVLDCPLATPSRSDVAAVDLANSRMALRAPQAEQGGPPPTTQGSQA